MEQGIAIDPKLALAHANYGDALASLGCYDEAIASLDVPLDLHSNLHNACRNRGVARRANGDDEDAMVDLDTTVARCADSATANYNHGLPHAYFLCGDNYRLGRQLDLASTNWHTSHATSALRNWLIIPRPTPAVALVLAEPCATWHVQYSWAKG